MKKINFTIFFLCCIIFSFAQIPSGYYNDAIGLHGYALKSALAHIIDGHTVYNFGDLQNYYYLTDPDPERDSLLIDIWGDCRFHPDQTGSNCYADSCICYDKEHVFSQRWMRPGSGDYSNDTCASFSDFHHIFPCDGGINRARGNMSYGEVANPRVQYNCGTKYGPNSFTSHYGHDVPNPSSSVFEPTLEYKGDVARALFYMATRYMFEESGFATDQPMTYHAQLRPWAAEMLLNWHLLDPVSQKEIDRNNAIYALQHNRNPFVDHPELVNMIFGLDTLTDFSEDYVEVVRPRVADFEINDVNSVTITFDSAMVASTLSNTANYIFNHGVSVDEVAVDSSNRITLTLSQPLTVGVYYYCIVRNVQALNGHFITDTAISFVHGYSANHTVFTGWTFDDVTNEVLENHWPLAANYGLLHSSGRLYYNGEYGASQFTYDTTSSFAYSELRNFAGNSGTITGDPRPNSDPSKCFAIQNRSANGKHFVLHFSTNNYKNLILTFARRITATGFSQYFYEWSYDGINYQPLTDTLSADPSTLGADYGLCELDLQEADFLELQPSVYLRITIDGAYSNYGNVRFDNICLHGQKCVAENVIIYDTIPQGGTYTNHGFNIPISASQALGTLEFERQVEVPGQCDSLYTLYLTIEVGVNDPSAPQFKIYPNPAHDQISIIGENLDFLQIYNCVGQKMTERAIENDNAIISLNNYNSGIYFVKIRTKSGASATQKVIIKK